MDAFQRWVSFCLHSRDKISGVPASTLYSHLWDKFRQWEGDAIDGRLEAFLAKELHYAIPLGSQWYPAEFLQLRKPPLIVFAVGNLQILYRERVAMVGTRRSSPLGRSRAQQWARYWVKQAGCVVVSGLASGIDQAAHE